MEYGSHSSLRLLAAALLTFGGLAAIVVGVILAMAPPETAACDLGTPCITGSALTPVADGVHHGSTN
jgi:hypothetical protein